MYGWTYGRHRTRFFEIEYCHPLMHRRECICDKLPVLCVTFIFCIISDIISACTRRKNQLAVRDFCSQLPHGCNTHGRCRWRPHWVICRVFFCCACEAACLNLLLALALLLVAPRHDLRKVVEGMLEQFCSCKTLGQRVAELSTPCQKKLKQFPFTKDRPFFVKMRKIVWNWILSTLRNFYRQRINFTVPAALSPCDGLHCITCSSW